MGVRGAQRPALLGHTLLRDRLLEARGWAVLSCSSAEWEAAGADQDADAAAAFVAERLGALAGVQ